MLIYAEFSKFLQSLRYFIGRILDAHSMQPENIFKI